MSDIMHIALLLPLFIMLYQFYAFAISATGAEKQRRCLTLGIISFAIGIPCLVFHSTLAVFGGMILMMFGFRLLAQGLDRIDKKIYIDRCADDDTPQ